MIVISSDCEENCSVNTGFEFKRQYLKLALCEAGSLALSKYARIWTFARSNVPVNNSAWIRTIKKDKASIVFFGRSHGLAGFIIIAAITIEMVKF
jgi:hypothetical protein